MIKILIKRLSKNIPLPKYEPSNSSGMDLAANIQNSVDIKPKETVIMFLLNFVIYTKKF